MNIVKLIDQYNENNVILCEPIKNNIMNEGSFIRLLYSDPNCILNGIYLFFSINDIICEKYYSKFKCIFNTLNYKGLIESIKVIEENLLKKCKITTNKLPQYKINEQLKNGNIKIFNEIENKSVCSFILKISGIWETHSNYGLTYKFMKVN
jgi:hypothetical protein